MVDLRCPLLLGVVTAQLCHVRSTSTSWSTFAARCCSVLSRLSSATSGRPAHHGRPSLPAVARCCHGSALPSVSSAQPSLPAVARCCHGSALPSVSSAQRFPASAQRCSHDRTLVTMSGVSLERLTGREHSVFQATARCCQAYRLHHSFPLPDIADAGVTLALVFDLPRLGFNDGDAVFHAMVCCLFVGCLELFRKALKRVLVDLTC